MLPASNEELIDLVAMETNGHFPNYDELKSEGLNLGRREEQSDLSGKHWYVLEEKEVEKG